MCEYPNFMNQSTPIARKEHKCEECGAVIKPGQRYIYTAGHWQGGVGFDTHKQCDLCAGLMDWLAGEVDCVAFGFVMETAWEHQLDGYEIPRDLLSLEMAELLNPDEK